MEKIVCDVCGFNARSRSALASHKRFKHCIFNYEKYVKMCEKSIDELQFLKNVVSSRKITLKERNIKDLEILSEGFLNYIKI